MSVKISGLTETGVLASSDVFPVVHSGETKKVTYNTLKSDILDSVPSSGGGSIIAGVSSDASSISAGDSLESGKLYIIYEE